MKKIGTSLIIFATMLLFISGCADQTSKPTDQQTSSLVKDEQATITLQEDGEDKLIKKVIFKTGQNLLAVLEENFTVEEDMGFITSINGHQQNEKEKRYWMFSVDGKNTRVGAKETILKDEQTVIFNLDTL
ncbi:MULTISPECIES: DUF4430 domain-containing protein [unclassified Enterococcus]|uniref:DUF4430 domain-containing protein n=1 Tax=unclassified Enterococcus TaxID=2608891 RepID=UPI001F5CCCF2|nr:MULTISPECIES: DUF4430 domain-containing protein [unclassified Enterococcus]